ncbi:dipicolinate synthase subunit A [Thermanaeromonas toyohensis ToBE]|uniref:Dipicolinate synthase subunit A n=1 Tax=Thermanaeromonas toyohensis ToBE TaxID=698762 RepID=A0A1W1VQI3_9FIRM|nr:dipicolinate synthase subunit DpsA [Thermanaeromonas toyohensis]SMB95625.1 dipicolinate synthase subunit A [Thermanaeromonas toyohensis ToBE]
MDQKLAGVRVGLIGGDARELVLIRELVRLGAEVKVAGFPPSPETHGCILTKDPAEVVRGTHVLILPVPGADTQGNIHAVLTGQTFHLEEKWVKEVAAGTPVLVGVARPILKQVATRYGWRLIETAEMDEMAILNSVPTAEGAIMLAMQEMPITLHGSQAFVLGLGRTGLTLAYMLAGIGARVTVVDRGAADRARAMALGWRAISFEELAHYISQAQVIFNTVPALVLTATVLSHTSPECLIIDLAAAPGGTDFVAAQKLGRKAMLAPGLPGKVAPRTAGEILARLYPRLILESLERP